MVGRPACYVKNVLEALHSDLLQLLNIIEWFSVTSVTDLFERDSN